MAKGTATKPKKQDAGGPGAADAGEGLPVAGTKAPSAKPAAAASAARAGAKADRKAGAEKPAAGAAAKPAAKSAAKTAAGAADAAPAPRVAGELRKKDLVARVAKRTGSKKSHVRDVVEAVLEELGAALSDGEGLNLPALGRARVNRQKETEGGGTMVVRFRRVAPRSVKLDPAEAAE